MPTNTGIIPPNASNFPFEPGEPLVLTEDTRQALQRVENIEISPRFSRATFASYVPNGFMSEDRPESEPEHKTFTAVQERKLSRLTSEIISDINHRIPFQGPTGRREEQYAELMRKNKKAKLSIKEIVGSEIPVYIRDINSAKLKQIFDSGDVAGAMRDNANMVKAICQTCFKEIPLHYAFFCAGSVFCAEHVPELGVCALCQKLTAKYQKVTTFDNRDIIACESCISDRNVCSRCNDEVLLPIEYVELGMCEDCLNRPSEGVPWREFSYALKWVSNDFGDIIKSTRLYSAEVEAISPTRSGLQHLGQKLPNENGISTDGSIDTTGDSFGFETQTPRLQGRKGEELVYRMGSVLKDMGAYVNKSCGLHIHLDGKGIIMPSRKEYPTALLQLWKAHLIFEDVIMSFLPYNRRRNDYCRPMKDNFKISELETCDSLLDIEKLWYQEDTYNEIRRSKGQHYHSSRYFGVNFHSLLGHGHLEIRYHSATTNPRKILEWANLHSLIMDAAAKKKLTADLLQEAQQTSVLRDKTELLFDAIGLEESSRRYFRTRQKKFGKKEVDEADITNNN